MQRGSLIDYHVSKQASHRKPVRGLFADDQPDKQVLGFLFSCCDRNQRFSHGNGRFWGPFGKIRLSPKSHSWIDGGQVKSTLLTNNLSINPFFITNLGISIQNLLRPTTYLFTWVRSTQIKVPKPFFRASLPFWNLSK